MQKIAHVGEIRFDLGSFTLKQTLCIFLVLLFIHIKTGSVHVLNTYST